jgi:hypothetical protein
MKSSDSIRKLCIALSLLSIGALTYVNFQIAARFNEASGKTRALFGLVEFMEFSYRYYILIPATISIVLIIYSKRLKELNTWDVAILLVGSITIIGTVTSSWRLMT